MHFPAGDVLGNRRDIGLSQLIRIHVVNPETAGFRSHQKDLLADPLDRFAVKEGISLTILCFRVAGQGQGVVPGLIDIQAAHGGDEDISAAGIFFEVPDKGLRVQRDSLVLHGLAVHHGEAAGFAGEPHPAAGILKKGIDERRGEIPVQERPARPLQAVRRRIDEYNLT